MHNGKKMNRMPNSVEPKRVEIDLKFAIMIVSYFMCLFRVPNSMTLAFRVNRTRDAHF